MALEDYLTANEKILFQSPGTVKLGDQDVKLYLTDIKCLFYRQTGWVSKKEEVVALKHSEIEQVSYREEGLFKKTGILRISRPKGALMISGDPGTLKSAWQSLQEYVK